MRFILSMLVNLQNSKKLLHFTEVIVILSILLSSFVLFAYERKQHNPDYKKNWVAFYFADPQLPEKGVTVENHSGKNANFEFCLVPDDNNLMEPNDLSCSLNTVVQSVTKSVTVGISENWAYSLPEKPGKYWVVLEYKDGDVLKSKDLSFEIR